MNALFGKEMNLLSQLSPHSTSMINLSLEKSVVGLKNLLKKLIKWKTPLIFSQMDDDLNFSQIEDDLIFFFKWKTTSIFS
jgi:hypothetical protein